MPKISIVDRNAKDYQNWLQPESPDHLTPRAVSSELVLTHEWQPGHHVFESRMVSVHHSFTSIAAGWTAIQDLLSPAPSDRFRYILYASIYLTASAASARGILCATATAPTIADGALVMAAAAPAGTPGGNVTVRHVVLPPSYGLYYMWYAIAAGEVSEANAIYADYRCCEPLPRL